MQRARLIVAAIAVTAATGVVSACGSDDPVASEQVPAPSAAVAASGDPLNEAEVEFAQGMIAHHEQAIEMSEIALDPNVGAGSAVVDLATRVKAAQDSEVELMTGWLTAAGQPVAMDTSDGHDMSSMEGMMSVEQMDALATMSGADFDTMWLGMMIEHHQGAISQAQTVKAEASNAEVAALAEQIIAAQQAEIAEMEALLGG